MAARPTYDALRDRCYEFQILRGQWSDYDSVACGLLLHRLQMLRMLLCLNSQQVHTSLSGSVLATSRISASTDISLVCTALCCSPKYHNHLLILLWLCVPVSHYHHRQVRFETVKLDDSPGHPKVTTLRQGSGLTKSASPSDSIVRRFANT
jgi:hypothetical protein